MLPDAVTTRPLATQPMVTRHRNHGTWVLGLLAMVMLFGCTGATWKHVRNAPAYQAPKAIAVAISVETAGEGLDEALGEFYLTLASELKSLGIAATMVERPPAASSAELRIIQWNKGSRWLRYWMDAAGEAYMVVMVRIASAEGRPGFSGVVRGHVNGGWFGGHHANAGEYAAAAIVKAIATGKAEQAQER